MSFPKRFTPMLAEVMFDDTKRRFQVCHVLEFKSEDEVDVVGHGYSLGTSDAPMPAYTIYPTLSEAMAALAKDLKAIGF